MKKLLVCMDGSAYADNVCSYAAWLAKTLPAGIALLHVMRRNSELQATKDLSGSLGLGARGNLLEELTKLDESVGKLNQRKGQLILDHGQAVLSTTGVSDPDLLHRRGSLVETIKDIESKYEVIVIGKRGEHAGPDSVELGSNLENVARASAKPIFVANAEYRPIHRFLIAYDGKGSAQKAVDFFAHHPSLNHLECHLLSVGDEPQQTVQGAVVMLKNAGYSVTTHIEKSGPIDKQIGEHLERHSIDWLAMGAYSHSPLRNFFLGSKTASLLLNSKVPVILFR